MQITIKVAVWAFLCPRAFCSCQEEEVAGADRAWAQERHFASAEEAEERGEEKGPEAGLPDVTAAGAAMAARPAAREALVADIEDAR
jgi:hypothetical protein